ncbi:putative bifunctional diguanylate cyclase/phosphodiesterase [Solirubrobacter soli]|uniref:putative bifunctional diguanylate cyclase/phosphodiesterase n=1 Tax=Solirubrobacter soli TaxID=363832 RepID=UPI00069FF36C|nr:EAL domain-containing protein [Solirubrobacter soli]
MLVATAAVLVRAFKRTQDRGAWVALTFALAANSAGAITLAAHHDALEFPSLADIFLLAFFPAAFVAAVLFARARVPRFGLALALDAVIGALGAAAVVTKLLGPALGADIGSASETALALAFPMGDALLVMMVGVALTLRGWRVNAVWVLLAAGVVLRTACDAAHVRAGVYGTGETWFAPVLGVSSMLVIAAAAWCRDSPPCQVARGGRHMLVMPTLLALLAAGLLVADHFHPTVDAVIWFSAATLVAVLGRVALTFAENNALHASRELALTDELTGLANRRLFHDRLNDELGGDNDTPLAVAMVDLDRFKELNDTLGHHAGDLLLAQLGPRLQEVVGEAGLVARMGGDEFALLLPGAGLAAATELSRRVGIALQTPFEIDGLEVVMDASIGAALCPDHGVDAEALLQRADVAMYQAKEARTGFQAYDSTRDRHSRERLALMAELRRALEGDELVLHYQPKVDLQTGLVAGVEALVRWQHPIHGLRGPGAFLPHAEHTALMRPLTLHVLETALSQLAEWRAMGLDLHVAVNLAVQNLLDLRTPRQVADLLDRHGLPAQALTLEVTESLMLHDPQRAGEVLADLADLGLGLALDDFGTGYSSLEHLKRLPVNELKIDKSFVMSMDRDAADRAIVASTSALGRSLGLRVVAEGVESHAAGSVLAAIGCDLAQGFHYSPPVPGEQIPGLVRAAVAMQVGVATVSDR